MTKVGFILSKVREVYNGSFFFLSFFGSLFVAYFFSSEIVEETFPLFSALIVIEIAYIAIFYSGGSGTEKARNQKWKIKNGEMNFYHYLLIKNYFSLLLRFFLLALLFITKNMIPEGPDILLSKLKSYFIMITASIAIFSIIITFDLMISMFYFLWGNIETKNKD
ncbi:hypothetical protein MWG07_12405 [Fusobacterium necrophorum]|uniref:Uncharacterized protein n=1 Tax=Fusobacterium necrophorum TaxID=859 RepID=A0AAW6WFK2_9FUSO|nr:hypothetical protein [Fusobacterium necrophorum]MDK4482054.1 hypothetical protein [Fusobacterium necrophorum]MDK4513052.1 hypothetical protein [Fusobacterium necrophorum]